jgi:hypothetical protein
VVQEVIPAQHHLEALVAVAVDKLVQEQVEQEQQDKVIMAVMEEVDSLEVVVGVLAVLELRL